MLQAIDDDTLVFWCKVQPLLRFVRRPHTLASSVEIPHGSTKIVIVIDDQDIHTSLGSGFLPLVTGKPRALPDEEVNYTERKAHDENQWVPIYGITAILPRETSRQPR